MDHFQTLGSLALGSRLRRFSDRIMGDGLKIYADSHIDFEPRWFPLVSLLHEREELSVGDAAAALGMTHASVSQIADLMTKKGILVSRKGRKDERRRVLRLTDEGKAMVDAVQPLWDDIRGGIDEIITEAGMDVLAAIERMERAMDNKSFYERVRRRSRDRQWDAINIIPYEHPKHQQAFTDFNVWWLEKYFTVEQIDRDIFADPVGYIIDKGGYIFMAQLDGEIVGTCSLINQGGGSFEMAKMGVAQHMQGRQIGRKLVEACVAKAMEVGARQVMLETNDCLTTALTLYRSMGFVVVPGKDMHPHYVRCNTYMVLDLQNERDAA